MELIVGGLIIGFVMFWVVAVPAAVVFTIRGAYRGAVGRTAADRAREDRDRAQADLQARREALVAHAAVDAEARRADALRRAQARRDADDGTWV